jgi:hypothetical protein
LLRVKFSLILGSAQTGLDWCLKEKTRSDICEANAWRVALHQGNTNNLLKKVTLSKKSERPGELYDSADRSAPKARQMVARGERAARRPWIQQNGSSSPERAIEDEDDKIKTTV